MLGAALAALLGRAVWRDIACRTISNRLNVVVALLAPFSWWAAGLALWPDVALQLGVALIVFLLFTGAFALGMMGGGDVKLLTALALWRVPLIRGEPPYAPILDLLVVMALAGGLVTLVTLFLHRRASAEGKPEIPYGVAIGLGALAAYGERYLNQFA